MKGRELTTGIGATRHCGRDATEGWRLCSGKRDENVARVHRSRKVLEFSAFFFFFKRSSSSDLQQLGNQHSTNKMGRTNFTIPLGICYSHLHHHFHTSLTISIFIPPIMKVHTFIVVAIVGRVFLADEVCLSLSCLCLLLFEN